MDYTCTFLFKYCVSGALVYVLYTVHVCPCQKKSGMDFLLKLHGA